MHMDGWRRTNEWMDCFVINNLGAPMPTSVTICTSMQILEEISIGEMTNLDRNVNPINTPQIRTASQKVSTKASPWVLNIESWHCELFSSRSFYRRAVVAVSGERCPWEMLDISYTGIVNDEDSTLGWTSELLQVTSSSRLPRDTWTFERGSVTLIMARRDATRPPSLFV